MLKIDFKDIDKKDIRKWERLVKDVRASGRETCLRLERMDGRFRPVSDVKHAIRYSNRLIKSLCS